MRSRIFLLGLAILVATATGCRKEDKAYVKGRITLAGEPLGNVQVWFVPPAGPSSAGATDADGRYELESGSKLGKRVFTGRCQVFLAQIIPQPEPDKPQPPPPPPRFHPRYLSATTGGLECELRTGPNTVDFDLEPNPAAEKKK